MKAEGKIRLAQASRAAAVCALILFAVRFIADANAQQSLASATIVVFNSDVPESAALAKFYAEKRGIPREQMVGLRCPIEEEISREDYDRTIAGPLRVLFQKKDWWSVRKPETKAGEPVVTSCRIRFVALIKGLPLKIRAVEKYPGDKPGEGPVATRNEASVDSELALLSRFDRTISGAMNNLYFKSYRRVMESADLPVLLVCRLDAPTAETVRRMIVEGIETEKNGLWGRAYLDAARKEGVGYEVGDEWLKEAAEELRKDGVPVVWDDEPEVFPTGYPMTDCALYYGWYTDGAAGPFAQPEFRFKPGAVAVHIHSFSAASLRNPNGNWVGPLLMRGAAASVGNVYEPYLQLTNHLDILNDRLLHGFTFAESAYMSIPALSWMSVMVGDPLYRPYASWLELNLGPDANADSPYRMYHEFALKNGSLPKLEYRKELRKTGSRAQNGVMIEDLGLMELHDGDWITAATCFQQARTIYSERPDVVRCALDEVPCWVKQGKPERAAALVRGIANTLPEGPTAVLLKKVAQDLLPKPAVTPSPSPK